MAHILDVEPEVLIEIFHHIGVVELLRFKVTCSKIYGIIDGAADLHYKIALEKTGMLSNPRCQDGIDDRLAWLKARDDAWGFFDVRDRNEVSVPAISSGLYDVSLTDAFVGMKSNDGSGSVGLMSIPLPSMFLGGDEELVDWNVLNLNMNILEFTLAVDEHDLVACLISSPEEEDPDTSNLMLVLMRHSTWEPHDMAKEPVLWVCRVKKAQGKPKIALQICGENIAIAVAFSIFETDVGPSGWLVFFDWKKGNMKSVPFPVFNPAIVFLREDIVAAPNSLRRSIDIYHIPSSESMASNPPCKYPFPTRARLIHALLLPELNESPGVRTNIISFSCHSSPIPTGGGIFPGNVPITHPYANDPERAIIVFALEAAQTEGDTTVTHDFHLIVHRQALLNLIPWDAILEDEVAEGHADDIAEALQRFALTRESMPFPDDAMPPGGIQKHGVPTQDWNDWGPSVTRWFNADDLSRAFISNSSGQRYVQYTRGGSISILDFNPWTVRRAYNGLGNKAPVEGPHCILSVVGLNQGGVEGDVLELEENMCSGEGMFAEDVVGTLPYVKCRSKEEFNFDGIVMHDEMLLGMKINRERRNLDTMSVLYFG
ncbi:unnamed protein product [Cyclocybe aegerita]|uniref:F-box domain-containing protein n=1 Tax=Cyclocybe aegerita TaxID=1973307 RepID=A0A8S0W8D0_CYCAE|nr:unnamed protein product [Cyclocybe aegerita]